MAATPQPDYVPVGASPNLTVVPTTPAAAVTKTLAGRATTPAVPTPRSLPANAPDEGVDLTQNAATLLQQQEAQKMAEIEQLLAQIEQTEEALNQAKQQNPPNQQQISGLQSELQSLGGQLSALINPDQGTNAAPVSSGPQFIPPPPVRPAAGFPGVQWNPGWVPQGAMGALAPALGMSQAYGQYARMPGAVAASPSGVSGTAGQNAQIVAAVARQKGVDPVTAVATMLAESSGNACQIGDGGTSCGLFQLHAGGELDTLAQQQGVSREQAMELAKNPVINANIALSEFARVQQANPGLDPGTLAAKAQRPKDPTAYAAQVNANIPEARRLLGLDSGAS